MGLFILSSFFVTSYCLNFFKNPYGRNMIGKGRRIFFPFFVFFSLFTNNLPPFLPLEVVRGQWVLFFSFFTLC